VLHPPGADNAAVMQVERIRLPTKQGIPHANLPTLA
jgi:hypothetical protein